LSWQVYIHPDKMGNANCIQHPPVVDGGNSVSEPSRNLDQDQGSLHAQSETTGLKWQKVTRKSDVPTKSSRRKGRRKIHASLVDCNSNSCVVFPSFSLLSDDIVLLILSFVSYAPGEGPLLAENAGTMPWSHQERPYRVFSATFADGRLIQSYNSETRKLMELVNRPKPYIIRPFQPSAYYMQTGSGDNQNSNPATVTTRTFGTLTHVLPLVCKRFYGLCNGEQSDMLWKLCLTRQARMDKTWEIGLNSFVSQKEGRRLSLVENGNVVPYQKNVLRRKSLVERACSVQSWKAIRNSIASNGCELTCSPMRLKRQLSNMSGSDFVRYATSGKARCIWREVHDSHLGYEGPVFCMPNRKPPLGYVFQLHLFEPRYRLLIKEVMAGRPASENNGMRISSLPKPTFLFCYGPQPIKPGSPGCIVEIRRCVLQYNGTAEILVVPKHFVVIEELHERPSSGRLLDARAHKVKETL